MPKTVRRGEDHNDWKRTVKRWSNIAIVCALVIGIGAVGLDFMVRGYRTAGEVVEKSRKYERLVKQNQQLEKQVEYLHTPAGEEEAIRRDLLYIGENEQLLDPATEPAPPTGRGAGPWLRGKLNASHQAITDFVSEVSLQVRCWLGLWKPPGPQHNRDLPASEP